MEPAPIVQKSYTLALWLLRKVESAQAAKARRQMSRNTPWVGRRSESVVRVFRKSFPRSHRFTLGDRITATTLDLQTALVEAAFTTRRTEPLQRAQRHLNTLRFLLRMSRDLKILTADSYGHAAAQLEEIGRMTGGWIKSASGSTA